MKEVRRWCAPVGLVICLAWAQAWFLGLSAGSLTIESPTPDSYSLLYTQALAGGHSHLPFAADPLLLAAKNPLAREYGAYHRGDASYYRGKFYLYFGVVPFATLTVPWLKATGTYLTDAAAIWVFSVLGLVGYSAAICLLWRRLFSKAGVATAFLAVALLSATNCSWLLLPRPSIYELVSAAAFGFFGVAVLSALLAALFTNRAVLWLSISSVGLGLTMGCRPNFAPAVCALALGLLWVALQSPSSRMARLAAVTVPLVLIGACLAWFNLARFDSILEFGFRYQYTAVDRTTRGLLLMEGITYGLHRYLFGLPSIAPYFPFFRGESPGPWLLPAGFEPTVLVYGCLVCTPAIVIAFWIFRSPERVPRVDSVVVLSRAILLGAFGNLVLLSAIGNGAYRYPVDFLAPWSMVAAVGVLQFADIAQTLVRRTLQVLATVLTFVSAILVIFQVFSLGQIWGQFETRRPDEYAKVQRAFNAVAYQWEHLTDTGPIGVKLICRLPADRFGKSEPLVARGSPGLIDILYVYYAAPGLIALGLSGGPLTGELSVDYGQDHTIEVHYGDDLPPDDHPLLRGIDNRDVRLARKAVTVLLDGRIVLDGWMDFSKTNGKVYFGESPDSAYGAHFSGTIKMIERPQMNFFLSPLRWKREAYGPLELSIIPVPMPIGTSDPIMSCGDRRQGAQLLVEHSAVGQARIGWIQTNGREFWSQPVGWPDRQRRVLRIAAGALLPPATSSLWPATASPAAIAEQKTGIVITLDGTEALTVNTDAISVSPTLIAVGSDELYLRNGVVRNFLGKTETIQRGIW